MRRKPSSPLPQRNGLDAARLKLPADGPWSSLRDHLVERLPRVAPARIEEMLREERIWAVSGPLGIDAPFVPDSYIWFHRDLPVEVPVPFDVTVVHQDDDIVVADKPHFLATIPRGRHIMQTALVKLRDSLGLPDLSPAHRLDRVTAGLVLFVVRRELRGKYQTMFRDRLVTKEYEAIAPHSPSLTLPTVVRSRIVKERGVITAFEVDGEPNAETHVSLVEHRNGLGRYHLKPLTGRTHQLRLHMSGLGVPIVNDDFYPVLRERPLDDFSSPLQLLARTLSFVDPISGEERSFTSGLKLSAWS
ncbi:RluA family pseudouridine synthase [Lentzea flava]|uniref:RNA pseudouridylate synthase n=1 Tax=Lentzea flava TaxID=103732 RepID=A0ABQ2UFT8_9PSEU|nr:RluA family pseudouridine synthase [Lentzea flava]MCP2198235.1 tRNA pseudouridine32 synthase / 23S rRNA pseudouridine746 synthase [Lentzea flava]GGU31109.1 pseudouridylate synthase [Lentzea flava]